MDRKRRPKRARKRRRNQQKDVRRLLVENLEGRMLLSASPNDAPISEGPFQGPVTVENPAPHLSGHLQDLIYGNPAPYTVSPVVFDSDGNVHVTVTAVDVEALRPSLEAVGFQHLASAPDFHLMEGTLPVNALDQLTPLVSEGLMGVMPTFEPEKAVGSVTSQADLVHEVSRLQAELGLPATLDGSGMTIGILSDSFDNFGTWKSQLAAAGTPDPDIGSYAVDVMNGDLPTGVNVLSDPPLPVGCASGPPCRPDHGDEGRAMAQLIHDLAPGASLSFATAIGGEATFQNNILNLSTAGADVLVDDVVYPAEPFYQDGIVAGAIDTVVANGKPYFASAGNYADFAYESTTFTTAADPSYIGDFYDFDPGPGVSTRLPVTIEPNQDVRLVLQWDDPFYTLFDVDTDLDIIVVEPGTSPAFTPNNNIASQRPAEILSFENITESSDFEVLIRHTSGPAPGRFKFLDLRRNMEGLPGAPTVFGGAAAAGAMAVGAVPYFDHRDEMFDPAIVDAGYTGFTSHGPSTILFDPSGNRLMDAMGNETEETRQKPNFSAVNGTNIANTTNISADARGNATSDPENDGFANFFGTSAASPHAAAIATLVLQHDSLLTPQEVYQRLSDTAQDIGAPGYDNIYGHGVINAYDAVMGAPDSVAYSAGQPYSVNETFENGALSNVWETHSTGGGAVQVTTDLNPASGTRHLVLGPIGTSISPSSGGPIAIPTLNEAILHLDLSQVDDVELSFQQRRLGLQIHEMMPEQFTGSNNSDGVAFSVDGGNQWHALLVEGEPFAFSNTFDVTYDFNLTDEAVARGLTLGSDVRVKFQNYLESPVGDRGYAFDDIQVTATPTPGVIQGEVWNDADGNGSFEAEEAGLDGWALFLDANQDGIWQPTEQVTQTSGGGVYTFEAVPPGAYQVVVEDRAGWDRTQPAQPFYAVDLNPGETIQFLDFGVTPGAPLVTGGDVDLSDPMVQEELLDGLEALQTVLTDVSNFGEFAEPLQLLNDSFGQMLDMGELFGAGLVTAVENYFDPPMGGAMFMAASTPTAAGLAEALAQLNILSDDYTISFDPASFGASVEDVAGGQELRFDVVYLGETNALDMALDADFTGLTEWELQGDVRNEFQLDFTFGLTPVDGELQFFTEIHDLTAGSQVADPEDSESGLRGFSEVDINPLASFDYQGELSVDFANPDADPNGRLTFDELAGNGVHTLVAITPAAGNQINVTVPVESEIGSYSTEGTDPQLAITSTNPFAGDEPDHVWNDAASELANFETVEPSDAAGILSQFGDWLQGIMDASEFDIELPFTDGIDFNGLIDVGLLFDVGVGNAMFVDPETPSFRSAQELVQQLTISTGFPVDTTLDYDVDTDVLTFRVLADYEVDLLDFPLDVEFDASPIASFETDSNIEITADAVLDVTFGIDLTPLGGDFELEPTTLLNDLHAGIGISIEQGHSDLFITFRNGELWEVNLDSLLDGTGDVSDTATVGDLLAILNADPRLTACLSSSGCSAIEGVAENDSLILIDETSGAGTFGVDLASSETGFSLAAASLGLLGQDEDFDGVLVGKPLHGDRLIDRFFIAEGSLSGEVNLTGADIAAEIGLLGLGVDLLNTAGNELDGSVEFEVSLMDPGTPNGDMDLVYDDRITIGELADAVIGNGSTTPAIDLDSLLDSPTLTGQATLSFDDVEIQGASFAGVLPENPFLTIDVSDISDVAASTEVSHNLEVGDLENFDPGAILDVLRQISGFLGDVTDIAPLNVPLPIIQQSLSDLLDLSSPLSAALSGLSSPASFDGLEVALLDALSGLSPTLDLTHDAEADVVSLQLEYTVDHSSELSLNLDLDSLGIAGLPDIVDAGGTGNLDAELQTTVLLDLGIDLSDPLTPVPFVRNATQIDIDFSIAGTPLTMNASVGPLGIFVVDGSFAVDADGEVGGNPATASITFDNSAEQYALDDLLNHVTAGMAPGVGLGVTLPMYFPNAATPMTGGAGPDSNQLTVQISDLQGFLEGTTDPIVVVPDIGDALNNLDLFSNLSVIVDGLDWLLGKVQDGLDNVAFVQRLPLIGDRLQEHGGVIENLRSELIGPLGDYLETHPATRDGVQEALYDLLREPQVAEAGVHLGYLLNNPNAGDDSPAITQEDIVITQHDTDGTGGDDELRFDMVLGRSIPLVDIPLGFDIGLPVLGFDLDANLELALSYTWHVAFGISEQHGFFIDPTPTDELQISLEVTIPDAEFTGSLAILQVKASDGTVFNNDEAVDPSHLTGSFVVDFMHPPGAGADDRVTLSELASSASDLSTVFDAGFQAEAELNLALEVSFNTGDVAEEDALFPTLVADLNLDWTFEPGANNEPQVEFNNIGLDLGAFVSRFVRPITDKLKVVLDPMKPAIDVLTFRLPVLSDIPTAVKILDLNSDNEVSILEMAIHLGVGGDSTKYINDFVKFYGLYERLSTLSGPGANQNVILQIRDNFNLSALPGVDLLDPDLDLQTINLSDEELGAAIADEIQAAAEALGTGDSPFAQAARGFFELAQRTSLDELDIEIEGMSQEESELSFPLIQNPAEALRLLLGQNPTIVFYDLAPLEASFTFRQFIPIFWWLGIEIEGGLGATADLAFGYDTQGMRDFIGSIQAGEPNPLRLLNGLFIDDLGENEDGIITDVAEASLWGYLNVSGALDAVVASASVGGGLEANIEGDLQDLDGDGKFRGSELREFLETRPQCIIDIHGALTAGAFARVKVGIGAAKITKRWDIATKTLAAFEHHCDPNEPFLATLQDGVLRLNIGERAEFREFGDLTVEDEVVTVTRPEDGPGNSVIVSAFGYSQEYSGVFQIIGDGGSGNDQITIAEDVTIPVELYGGMGDDKLFAGAGAAILHGGAGLDELVGGPQGDYLYGDEHDDLLVGGAGEDFLSGGGGQDNLFGDEDDDTLQGGAGADLMFGGEGSDELSGGTENDQLEGGDGDDVLRGGGGNDTVLAGYGEDFVEGGAGDDEIIAGHDDDTVLGGSGNDQISGGQGSDQLDGGSGNDVLEGEEGADTLQGNAGDDQLLGGEGADDLAGGSGRDLIYGDTGADVADGGPGNDEVFGEAGNDTLRGGSGDDRIEGGVGEDLLEGDGGNDLLLGQDNDDTLRGGSGQDHLEGADGDDLLEGGSGIDQLSGGLDDDELFGDEGDDVLLGDNPEDGNSGDDELHGGPGRDRLLAGNGDDLLLGGRDADLLVGSFGIDTLLGGWGDDLIYSHLPGDQSTTNYELIEGGPDDDFICGTHGPNDVYGGTATFGYSYLTPLAVPSPTPLPGGFVQVPCHVDEGEQPVEGDFPYQPDLEAYFDALILQTATVSGVKFLDLNGNGIQEPGEAGFGGVEIFADLNDNGERDAGEPHTITELGGDVEGSYELSGLLPGSYVIRETTPENFTVTTPASGGHSVSVAAGDVLENVDFGNSPQGAVSGKVWRDMNGDGVENIGDPWLAGITVYVDMNVNGQPDDFEPQAETGILGHYSIPNVAAGEHRVRQVVPAGWVATHPGGNQPHLVQVTGGESTTGVDFGNARAQGFEGWKWSDINGNRSPDPNEPGVPGVVIYVDLNENAERDEGEPWAITREDDPRTEEDEAGRYHISFPFDLSTEAAREALEQHLGNTYLVREVVPDNFEQTFPEPGFHDARLDNEPRDFANRPTGAIHGTAWDDLNANGIWDNSEPGLPGVTIYLDVNSNGVLDGGDVSTLSVADDPATAANEAGRYAFTGLSLGTYTVLMVASPGYTHSYPMSFDHKVEFTEASFVEGVNFGSFEHAEVEGVKWIDQDGDGARGPNEPGLAGVVIYSDLNGNGFLDEGEPSTISRQSGSPDAALGAYVLSGLVPGDHTIREVVPQGYLQTSPGVELLGEIPIPGSHSLTLEAGQTATGADFANQPLLGNVAGLVWVDSDQDGQRDADEPGLPGVTIYLDVNRNDLFDAGDLRAVSACDDPATRANEAGTYEIAGVSAGSYLIREVVPAGYALPPILRLPVAVNALSTTDGVNFANVRTQGSPVLSTCEVPAGRIRTTGEAAQETANTPAAPTALGSTEVQAAAQGVVPQPTTFAPTDTSPPIEQTENAVFDFGDLPDPFPTSLLDDGARHFVIEGIHLGGSVDTEMAAQQHPWALGDDLADEQDDDGVFFLQPLVKGQSADVRVVASAPGILNAWLDANGDGDWDDVGERIVASQPLSAGVNVLSVAVPDTDFPFEPVSVAAARFRFGPSDTPTYNGIASGGEVEDYVVTVDGQDQPPWEVAVGINDVTILEGDSGTQDAEFTVSLSAAALHPVTVAYSTTDGDAVAGMDYETTSGFVVIPAGSTSAAIQVPVVGDLIAENLESFFVQITNASGAIVVDDEGEGVVVDNDDPSQVGTIEGLKWLDQNENGVRDEGEPGEPGVVVYLDVLANGEWDPFEPFTVTLEDDPATEADERGRYALLAPAGEWRVREILDPPGWTQTFPESGFHTVVVPAGGTVSDVDFGNIVLLPDGDDTVFAGSAADLVYGDNLVNDPRVRSVGTRRDTLDGEAGDDTIRAQERDDLLIGGEDEDLLDGGDGIDRVWQMVDADQELIPAMAPIDYELTGQGPDDLISIERATLIGGSSDNVLDASEFEPGPVILVGGDGNDTLIGSPNDDELIGGDGSDEVDGRMGDDLYVFDPVASGVAEVDTIIEAVLGGRDTLDFSSLPTGDDLTVDLSETEQLVFGDHLLREIQVPITSGQQPALERVLGGAGNDLLTGNDSGNDLLGNAGQDTLNGGLGDDLLEGGADADILTGGADNDDLNGGSDSDLYLFEAAWGIDILADSAGSNDHVDFSAVGDSLQVQIGSLIVTNGPNMLTHSEDELERVTTGTANDEFHFTHDSATFAAGTGVLDAGAGNDWLNYELLSAAAPVAVDLANGTATGAGSVIGFENAIGGAGDDTLLGGVGDNELVGGAGADLLTGGQGNDQLGGGGGDDTYFFGLPGVSEQDVIFEEAGGGSDTLDFSENGSPVRVNLGSDQLVALAAGGRELSVAFAGQSANLENVIGTPFDDAILANGADNRLSGGLGDDSYRIPDGLTGTVRLLEAPDEGADEISFEQVTGPVTFDLNTGVNAPFGGLTVVLWDPTEVDAPENFEVLIGGSSDDVLTANNGGGNRISGGGGADTLNARGSSNQLAGGDGDDVYVLDDSSTGTVIQEGISAAAGSDTLDVSSLSEAVTIDLDLAASQAITASGQTVTLAGAIENFVGTTLSDSIRAGATGLLRSIDGGNPVAPASPGDTLTVDGGGAAVAFGAGEVLVGGAAAITHVSIETLRTENATELVLDAGANADDGAADTFLLGTDGANTALAVNGQIVYSAPTVEVPHLVIQGSGDDDTLVVSFATGDPIPRGLSFHGGGQVAADTLVLFGAGSQSGVYEPDPETFGNGTVTIGAATIEFTGLEPVIVHDLATLTFVSPGSQDNLIVDSVAADQNRIRGDSDGLSFEEIIFHAVANVEIDVQRNDVPGLNNDLITFEADLVAGGLETLTIVAGDEDTVAATNVTSFSPSRQGGVWSFAGGDPLSVTSFEPTVSGVRLQFNTTVDPDVLDVLDVELSGAASGPIGGSLVLNAAGDGVQFVKTDGVLETDNYTLTLRTGREAWKTSLGSMLDGNGDGTGGDEYTTSFAVDTEGALRIGIPDFVRGPGQPINLPADVDSGLPLSVSDGANVRSVEVRIGYDPALLEISGVEVAPGLPEGATAVLRVDSPGVAVVEFSTPSALPTGEVTLVNLRASVPTVNAGDIYGRQQRLDLHAASVRDADRNEVPTLVDDAVHVVAYFGDASGNGRINANDASLVARYAALLETGFSSMPLTDPMLLADISGNRRINARDASLLAQFAALFDVPEIPELPAGTALGANANGESAVVIPRQANRKPAAQRVTTQSSDGGEADSLPSQEIPRALVDRSMVEYGADADELMELPELEETLEELFRGLGF